MIFDRTNTAFYGAIMRQAAAHNAWIERTCRAIFDERGLPQPRNMDEWRDAVRECGWVLGYTPDGDLRLLEGEAVLASFRVHIATEVS